MALTATVYNLAIQLADIDREYAKGRLRQVSPDLVYNMPSGDKRP
jgi:uncharacterized protein YaeQ